MYCSFLTIWSNPSIAVSLSNSYSYKVVLNFSLFSLWVFSFFESFLTLYTYSIHYKIGSHDQHLFIKSAFASSMIVSFFLIVDKTSFFKSFNQNSSIKVTNFYLCNILSNSEFTTILLNKREQNEINKL